MTAQAAPVIDDIRHKRLLEDLDHVCSVAGIPKALIHESAVGTLSPVELDWLRQYRVHQAAGTGLILTGNHKPSAETKMMAMTAAFLRNFIDARIMSVNTIVDQLGEGMPMDATVLLVPNFHVQLSKGRAFQTWKAQFLYDMLLARKQAGKINVLYVSDKTAMREDYGQPFADHMAGYLVSQGE